MSGTKDMALTLVKFAAIWFPPLGELLADAIQALDPAQSSNEPLIKQVRDVLPERSLSEQVLIDLTHDEDTGDPPPSQPPNQEPPQ